MRAYTQRFEAKTETNGAGTHLAAKPDFRSTDIQSTFDGRMELPLKKDHLRSVSWLPTAKPTTDRPLDKPRCVDWVMVSFWSFVVFSFGALLFCLYVIHAKCYGGWRFWI